MAKLKSLKQLSQFLLGLLILQYISGMILNLFVALPKTHAGNTGNSNFFVRSLHSYGWAITIGGGALLFLHVLIATGLVIGSVIFLVKAIRHRQASWIWASAISCFGILAAFSNGLSFLDYNHDLNSFFMAVGFIVAAASYAVGLTLSESQSALNHQPEKS